jgi:hypothetical protein
VRVRQRATTGKRCCSVFRRALASELVLIGSDSLETVKITHANYFDGTVAVSKYFAGI